MVKFCFHFAYAALDVTELTRDVDWQQVCTIIELVPEGVMLVERILG